MENKMALDTLPDLVLENILKYFSYDEIAKFRSISTKFNLICKSMLTKGFKAVEKYHLKCLKEMKGKLPRRESERRDHPLARHCDILTAIETRISLLGMTFMKFIELDLCCFIPGKVIDEIYSVLRNIQSIKNPNRSCEVLQELRDISSMAMEYFDEKIAPGLRLYPASPNRLNSGYFSGIFSSGTGFSLSMRYSDSLSPPSTPLCRLPLNQAVSEPVPRARPSFMRALQTTAKTPNRKPSVKASRLVRDLKKQADSYKTAVESQNKKMLELDRRIDQQNELINEQNARLAEQEEKLAQMSRRLSENTSQFTGMDEGKSKMMTKIDLGMRMHPCSSSSSQPALSCETLPRGENTNSRFGEDENITRPRKRGRSDDIKEDTAMVSGTPKRVRK